MKRKLYEINQKYTFLQENRKFPVKESKCKPTTSGKQN